MRRTVSLTALVLALAPPAHAQPLRHIDALVAARVYVHRSWHDPPYRAHCHRRWCRVTVFPSGCGCSPDHPSYLIVTIHIARVRDGLSVREDVFGERFLIRWRPL